MKKRVVSRMLAGVLAVVMLAGCGQGASSSNTEQPGTAQAESGEEADAEGSENSETVTIEFMHDEAEEDRIAVWQEIIDSFTAENPGIEVVQIPVSEDGFETKVKTLISAGEMPAVVASSASMMQLLDKEEIINTAANKEVVEEKGRDEFYENVLQLLNSQDGEGMIGVPITAWVSGIWYRKDLFEEKGLNAPETWEDILKAAEAFHDPENKMYGIMFGTAEAAITQQHFQMLAATNGAELFDKDGNPQFNSKEMKETMEFYRELYKYSLPGSNAVTEIRDAMVGGNTAMCLFSTYIMGPLYNAGMADKIGYCVPKNVESAVFGSPSTLTISNTITEEETEAAKKFLGWLLTEDINVKLLNIAPGGPKAVLREVAENPEYTSTEVLNAYAEENDKIATAFESLEVLGTQDGVTNPDAGTIINSMIIGKAVNQILVQGEDLDKVMDSAQADMEKAVGR